ncbi:MAG: hypothetical protein EAZ85_09225 [Bacteroidetes bacterium]|nr:MAG: hypothetical protein EAZ85_09225 [Bacteroidota bacterium]TAG88268.1 MAG: hypothetical protein EAZ20_08880 [Bacteroidota bacterium]
MNILLKKNIHTFLLLLAGILFVWSCKPKKDPQPVPIPCEQLADFKIYETYERQNITIAEDDRWYSYTAEEDTFVMGEGISDHRVFFEAKQGADKYEWWIGNETTPRVGKKISVLFLASQIPLDITIPIKLKVTKQDRKDCNVDGIYAITKTITLLRPNKVPFAGRYVAYDENNQPKIIEITADLDPVYFNTVYKLKNLIGRGACNIISFNTIRYCTAFSFAIRGIDVLVPPVNCYAKYGFGYLDSQNRNKLILEYSISRWPTFPIEIKKIIAYRIP